MPVCYNRRVVIRDTRELNGCCASGPPSQDHQPRDITSRNDDSLDGDRDSRSTLKFIKTSPRRRSLVAINRSLASRCFPLTIPELELEHTYTIVERIVRRRGGWFSMVMQRHWHIKIARDYTPTFSSCKEEHDCLHPGIVKSWHLERCKPISTMAIETVISDLLRHSRSPKRVRSNFKVFVITLSLLVFLQ